MEEKSITINEIISKLSKQEVENPKELSNYLVMMTANFWKYGKDTLTADTICSKKWQEIRLNCKTDGQANIRIKAEPEYYTWQMSRIAEKTLLELIRSVKSRLRSFNDEMRTY